MDKKEKFVITINRELGSGGRTVGEKLAAKLGVAFYDKTLIKALEKQFHLTKEEIERLKGQSHTWWAEFKRNLIPMQNVSGPQFYTVDMGKEPEMLTTEAMIEAETTILETIAREESCVITGRSGFYVFRQHPNHLSVLIQAPMENRIERLIGKGYTRQEAEKVIKLVDKQRENYVSKYTKSSRYDTRNYDLVINMANINEDLAVKLILDYIGVK